MTTVRPPRPETLGIIKFCGNDTLVERFVYFDYAIVIRVMFCVPDKIVYAPMSRTEMDCLDKASGFSKKMSHGYIRFLRLDGIYNFLGFDLVLERHRSDQFFYKNTRWVRSLEPYYLETLIKDDVYAIFYDSLKRIMKENGLMVPRGF